LLCTLALGLIGMHNLAVGDPVPMAMGNTAVPSAAVAQMPAADTAGKSCCGGDHDAGNEQPGHSSDHDMLHLCLAVLMAAAALIMAWMLGRRGHPSRTRHEPRTSLVRAGRGPPFSPKTGDLLSSLCVLRV
jgi:hypothetical protein